MELYFFHPEEHQRLYGCQNITIEDVPLEKRQHVTEGVITIFLTIVYYILYIPCIPSIYRHMKNPCYKLLFYITIVDCSILWVVGFVHGYFSIAGVVFCTHPTFIYILGSYIWFFWICETSGQLCLVINRCVVMLSPDLEGTLFGGKRVYLWIGASIAWGFYWFFYNIPLLFTGLYFTWFLNPYIGYREDTSGDYNSFSHLIWDGGFAIVIPTLYIIFTLIFYSKSHKMHGSKEAAKQQKMMILQVFIVSLINFCTTSIYVCMMYVAVNNFLMHFAQFCWFHIHGFPPVIYLIFNSSIRKDSKRMAKRLFRKLTGVKIEISVTQSIAKFETSKNLASKLNV